MHHPAFLQACGEVNGATINLAGTPHNTPEADAPRNSEDQFRGRLSWENEHEYGYWYWIKMERRGFGRGDAYSSGLRSSDDAGDDDVRGLISRDVSMPSKDLAYAKRRIAERCASIEEFLVAYACGKALGW